MVTRPKVALPISRSFNEVVTLDLKEFGSKCILWMINSFTRFIQGKLISNKKADTIIQALMDSWCMSDGFPSHGFFADNGGAFANIKLDKLTSELDSQSSLDHHIHHGSMAPMKGIMQVQILPLKS